MDFIAKKTELAKHKTNCAVVFVAESHLLPSAALADKQFKGAVKHALSLKTKEPSVGGCSWIGVPPASKSQPFQRLLLVQLGKLKSNTITAKSWYTASKAAIATVAHLAIKDISLFIDDLTIEGDDKHIEMGRLLARAAHEATYSYTTTKASVKETQLTKVSVISAAPGMKKGLSEGNALGIGINTTRELGNLPGNICTPSYLAALATTMARSSEKLTTKVLNEKQMEKLGMGSLLSVSHGSDQEAKFIIMEYKNGPAKSKPHVLVGKGITFDTGGISIKPGPQMDEMKFDMCGAASVFGTIKALTTLQAKVNVIGVVAAAENMPSGRATKPGDVVTSMSGQTIEVLNTDAEGRLVLCDALTYVERFKPKSVVDIATLTGACVIALGNHASGLYSNDDALAAALIESGERNFDRAWRMPLWDEYQKALDSNFADMANIGGREAGSVTAACFLSRFTKEYKWAHLDIAGSAWVSGAKKGATGRPVSLLFDYVLNN